MRYLIYSILIIILTTVQVTFAQDASYYYNRGNEYLNSSNYYKAISEFDKAIALDPKYVEAYVSRGTVKSKLLLNEEALQDYNKAIELNSVYALAYYDRGCVKNELALYQEAIKDFTKYIELDPDNLLVYTVYYNRGRAKFEIGLYQEALRDFNYTIRLNPNYVEAYVFRGTVKSKLLLYEEALEDYNKAIELNSGYALAYYDRACVKNELALYQEAIKDFTKYIELDPDNLLEYTGYFNRGIAKEKLGLYQGAIQDYTKAFELKPDFIQAKTALNNLKNQISINPVSKPKIWVVAVGLSVYENEKLMTSLYSPVTKAYDFARFLESINFVNEKIPVLINFEANKDNILQTLESTFLDGNKVDENDMIIFYYSGHGAAVGDQSGICPYEYINPQQLITDQEILDILQKSPARHKICIIEACKTKARALSPISEASLNRFNEERKKIPGSIVYITSTKIGEESIEVPPVGTVFSYYFLKGITEGKADINKDGIIRVKELFDYVKFNVTQYTSNTQIPQINQEGYESDIPILVYK